LPKAAELSTEREIHDYAHFLIYPQGIKEQLWYWVLPRPGASAIHQLASEFVSQKKTVGLNAVALAVLRPPLLPERWVAFFQQGVEP
jgi:hypothetical protein